MHLSREVPLKRLPLHSYMNVLDDTLQLRTSREEVYKCVPELRAPISMYMLSVQGHLPLMYVYSSVTQQAWRCLHCSEQALCATLTTAVAISYSVAPNIVVQSII
jgi:hypothetical protein